MFARLLAPSFLVSFKLFHLGSLSAGIFFCLLYLLLLFCLFPVSLQLLTGVVTLHPHPSLLVTAARLPLLSLAGAAQVNLPVARLGCRATATVANVGTLVVALHHLGTDAATRPEGVLAVSASLQPLVTRNVLENGSAVTPHADHGRARGTRARVTLLQARVGTARRAVLPAIRFTTLAILSSPNAVWCSLHNVTLALTDVVVAVQLPATNATTGIWLYV